MRPKMWKTLPIIYLGGRVRILVWLGNLTLFFSGKYNIYSVFGLMTSHPRNFLLANSNYFFSLSQSYDHFLRLKIRIFFWENFNRFLFGVIWNTYAPIFIMPLYTVCPFSIFFYGYLFQFQSGRIMTAILSCFHNLGMCLELCIIVKKKGVKLDQWIILHIIWRIYNNIFKIDLCFFY